MDNIVFSLQRAGGISVVWSELLNRLLNDQDVKLKVIDYGGENIFRKQIALPNDIIIKESFPDLPLNIKRYLNPSFISENGIFHSSYFRISKNFKHVNISTIHDFTYEYFMGGLSKVVHLQQKKAAINDSVKVICVSKSTKSDLLKFHPNVCEDNVKVIYNGVDKAYKVVNGSNLDLINSLIPSRIEEYVLYVGDRKCDYKNFRIAVGACKFANVPLIIIGGGGLSIREKSFLEKILGVKNFYVLNGISCESLNILYNSALCLLYPSSYEGFGIPILEAQRAGCPVICSNNSCIPEIAGNGGVFVENIDYESFGEAIRFVRSETSFRNTIISNGLLNSERFSWENCYLETKKLYKEVWDNYF